MGMMVVARMIALEVNQIIDIKVHYKLGVS